MFTSSLRMFNRIYWNTCAQNIRKFNIFGNFTRNYGTTYVPHLKKTPKLSDSTAVKEIIESYDTFLVDLDGTLWATDHYNSLPGIPRAIEFLRNKGKQILFVTNNSFHSNSHYLNKFKTQGFEAEEHEVFGVAYVSALYLKDILNVTGDIYMLGSHGMAHELDKLGLKHFGLGRDPDATSLQVDDLLKMEFRENVQAVLMGFDKDFHYNKIYKAASYLMNKDCHFIATNDVEIAVQIAPNRLQPTTGSLIASVATASKRAPVVLGKPHTLMFDCVVDKYPETDPKRTLFVGDSLKADIRFANNVGIDSVLVLTGANKMEDFKDFPDAIPTYVLSSFADFYIP